MKALWPEFRRDERGNMAILFAFGFTISALVSAVAVDAAALYHERRLMQAGVDLAAISAAADPSRATEIAQSVLVGARLLAPASTEGLSVVTGRYDAIIANPQSRFQPGQAPANAVAITLEKPGTLHFASNFAASPDIRATGIAAVTPEVSFSLGSRLASLNGGIANALLSDLLGTSVSLNLVDYNALAAAQIDALGLLDALAQQLDLEVGTYDTLLASQVSAGQLAAALAQLSTGAARPLLNTLAASGAGQSVPLWPLFSLGRYADLRLGSAGAVDVKLSVLDILSAAALAAGGDRQVGLNLAAGVPGLVSLRLDLALGEPVQGGGWFATGGPGTLLRTAQMRLRLAARLLGGPILLGAGVNLPLWLDLAQSEAKVVSATCPSPAAPHGSATIAAKPGLARLAIGSLSDSALRDFAAPPKVDAVRLIDVLLLKVTGSAYAELAATTPTALNFSSAEIATGTVKTARTDTLVTSLVTSLLGELDLSVSVLGIGLASPAIIAKAVRDLLSPLAPTLDMTIAGTLSALGVGVGEADIRVYGVRCEHAVLVG